jgi:hypothetical protein
MYRGTQMLLDNHAVCATCSSVFPKAWLNKEHGGRKIGNAYFCSEICTLRWLGRSESEVTPPLGPEIDLDYEEDDYHPLGGNG